MEVKGHTPLQENSDTITDLIDTEAFEENEEETEFQEPGWVIAVQGAREKQAQDILVLDLSGVTTFTDHFVICCGTNPRQNQAITDEIHFQLKKRGEIPHSIEGYEQGEWILSDYGDFLVHVFSPKSREYYSLERLWREGKPVELPPELPLELPAE